MLHLDRPNWLLTTIVLVTLPILELLLQQRTTRAADSLVVSWPKARTMSTAAPILCAYKAQLYIQITFRTII